MYAKEWVSQPQPILIRFFTVIPDASPTASVQVMNGGQCDV